MGPLLQRDLSVQYYHQNVIQARAASYLDPFVVATFIVPRAFHICIWLCD